MFRYFISSLKEKQPPFQPSVRWLRTLLLLCKGLNIPQIPLGVFLPVPAQTPPSVPAPGSSGRPSGGQCGQQPGAGAGSSFHPPSPLGLLPPTHTSGCYYTSIVQLFVTHCDTVIQQRAPRAHFIKGALEEPMFHFKKLLRSVFITEPVPKDLEKTAS